MNASDFNERIGNKSASKKRILMIFTMIIIRISFLLAMNTLDPPS